MKMLKKDINIKVMHTELYITKIQKIRSIKESASNKVECII